MKIIEPELCVLCNSMNHTATYRDMDGLVIDSGCHDVQFEDGIGRVCFDCKGKYQRREIRPINVPRILNSSPMVI